MKILALVFLLFGISAAIPAEDLERAKDEAILRFMLEMEQAPSLGEVMNFDHQELNEVGDEIKSDLVNVLKEALEALLKRIKEAVDHGKTVKEEMKEHVEKIKQELKKLHNEISEKAKAILERLKEKAKGKFKEWIGKILGREDSEAYDVAFSEEDPKGKFRKFLEELREKLEEKGRDLKKLKEEVKEKMKEKTMLAKLIMEQMKEETVDKLKELLDKLLNRKETRDIKDLLEKVKDYLKERREDFEKHFSRFIDWVKKVYESGYEAAKSRIENVRKVARKFLEHVKDVGKKTADEALEFFRPYKEDLGTLWDELTKAVKETYGKHH